MTARLDLESVPFLDGHLHPPYRQTPRDPHGYRWPWYEGSPADTALVPELSVYRWAITELAEHLGCEPNEPDVRDEIARRDPRAWLAEVVKAAGVCGLAVDTGYPPPEETLPPAEIAVAAGVPVAPLLRIEHRAGELADEQASFEGFLERFDAELATAREHGYAGLKTVIAYRSGLAVEPAGTEQAAQGFARARAGGSPVRLADKALLDFLLVRALDVARREELPVQVHCGYGDRDLDLPLANPQRLRPLLESGAADGVPLVLLHGSYPYHAEAAVLVANHASLYFDVGTCIPPLGYAAQLDVWRAALAVCPLSRIQASSDSAGLPEQIALGAWWARRGLAAALEELVAARALRAGEAQDVAAAVLADNARRLYLG